MEIPLFGTGGARGLAENEINGEMIAQITAAAVTVWQKDCKLPLLIGYDTRRDSRYYGQKAALAAINRGTDAVLFATAIPTPLLSFGLRQGHYCGGVMITASHNPKEYNGIKLYNAAGGQLTPEETEPVTALLRQGKLPESKKRGVLFATGKAEKAAYLNAICRYRVKETLKIVATPLHGSGKELLAAALTKAGHQVIPVPCQEICDGRFATVTAPNPEDSAVFRYGRAIAAATAADLVIALDGDGDRCGCLCRCHREYLPLNGNEIAAFLLSYLLQRDRDKLPAKGYIARTAVSGSTAEKIAAAYGIAVKITPTGFKFIGKELITPRNGTFLGGFEESYGFLWGSHAADKDGIATAVLLAEATAFYKKQGKTPHTVLSELYDRYGKELTATDRIELPQTAATAFLRDFTAAFPKHCHEDCNTLFYEPEKGIKIALRPSGTEPKLKFYYLLTGEDSTVKLQQAKAFMKKALNDFYSANSGVER